jgi:hypothetical protein
VLDALDDDDEDDDDEDADMSPDIRTFIKFSNTRFFIFKIFTRIMRLNLFKHSKTNPFLKITWKLFFMINFKLNTF